MSRDAPAKSEKSRSPMPVPDLTKALDETTYRQLMSLPEDERKLLHGLALWLNYHSMREASRIAGCPYGTLRYRIQGAGLAEVDRNAVSQDVANLASQIMQEAGRITLEGLQNGDISASQAPIVYGISTDKLLKAAQIGQPKDAGGELHKVLEMLQEQGGGQVTLGYQPSHERPAERVIDVEREDG